MHIVMWPVFKLMKLLLRCIPALFRSRNEQAIVELVLRQQLACRFSKLVHRPSNRRLA